MKKFFLIVIIISSILFGQIPRDTLSEQLQDSLKFGDINPEFVPDKEVLKISIAPEHKLKSDPNRGVGICIMVISGGLSWYYHQEADKAYEKYMTMGNFEEMNRLYDDAQKYDKYSGWLYIGMEVGFLVTVFSFLK